MRRLFTSALGLTALLGAARTASAGSIQTFGAQTQYQDAYPDQYDLCLTVNSSFHLESDYCANSSNQQLTFDGTYITYTVGSTTYYATNRGSYVSMETAAYSTRQQWYLEGSNLVSAYDYHCMDVLWGNTNNGGTMDVYTCNGTQAQWFWVPGSWEFSLYNYGSGHCLTEASGAYSVSTCNYGSTQKWVFTNDQQIQNVASGHCIQENSNGTLSPVSCDASYWTSGQEWSAGTTYYGFFQSWYTGLCLTDSSGTPKTQTCSDPSSGNTSQFWIEN